MRFTSFLILTTAASNAFIFGLPWIGLGCLTLALGLAAAAAIDYAKESKR